MCLHIIPHISCLFNKNPTFYAPFQLQKVLRFIQCSTLHILLHILQEKQDEALFRAEWKSLRAPGMAANGKWAEKKLIICLPLSLAAIIMFTMPPHHLGELRRRWESRPPVSAADVAVLKDSYDLCLSDQASCYSANSHINLLSDLTETQSVWQIHSQRMPGILLFALDRCLRIQIPPAEWRYTAERRTKTRLQGSSLAFSHCYC